MLRVARLARLGAGVRALHASRPAALVKLPWDDEDEAPWFTREAIDARQKPPEKKSLWAVLSSDSYDPVQAAMGAAAPAPSTPMVSSRSPSSAASASSSSLQSSLDMPPPDMPPPDMPPPAESSESSESSGDGKEGRK